MKNRIMWVLTLVIGLLPIAATAQYGTIDYNFGVNGASGYTSDSLGRVIDILAQKDHKLLSLYPLNTTVGDTTRFYLLRRNADGTVDSTFGNQGRVLVQWDSAMSNGGHRVFQEPDGSYLVFGNQIDYYNGALIQHKGVLIQRIFENGMPDLALGQKSVGYGIFKDVIAVDSGYTMLIDSLGPVLIPVDFNGDIRMWVGKQRIPVNANPLKILGLSGNHYVLLCYQQWVGNVLTTIKVTSSLKVDSTLGTNGVFTDALSLPTPLLIGASVISGDSVRVAFQENYVAVYDAAGRRAYLNGNASTNNGQVSFAVAASNKSYSLKLGFSSFNVEATSAAGGLDQAFGSSGILSTQVHYVPNWPPPVIASDGANLYVETNINQDSTVMVKIQLVDNLNVWPGDANSDGFADQNDLLPIGLAYNANGPVRANASLVWQAQSANNWSQNFNGTVNYKHADCDGNGSINADDTLAILQNFSQVHAKQEAGAGEWRAGVPGLYLIAERDTLYNNDTLRISITAGNASLPLNSIYGLAFNFHYNSLVTVPNSESFAFLNAFMGNPGTKIDFRKSAGGSGVVHAAITGIDHTNRSGFGDLARFVATITTGNINGKNYQYFDAGCYISDLVAIDKDGHAVDLNAGAASIKVGFEPNGIQYVAAMDVKVYPNPVGSTLFLQAKVRNIPFQLVDVAGRQLLSGTTNTEIEQVNLVNLEPGVYLLNFGGMPFRILKN